MTSNDGTKHGIDDDGIDYFVTALGHFIDDVPADERFGVFRTGGPPTEQVEEEMNEFIERHLDGRGAQFDSVFDPEYTNAQVLFGCAETEHLEWRLIYRASKGRTFFLDSFLLDPFLAGPSDEIFSRSTRCRLYE